MDSKMDEAEAYVIEMRAAGEHKDYIGERGSASVHYRAANVVEGLLKEVEREREARVTAQAQLEQAIRLAWDQYWTKEEAVDGL